jgi:hypothetical protein
VSMYRAISSSAARSSRCRLSALTCGLTKVQESGLKGERCAPYELSAGPSSSVTGRPWRAPSCHVWIACGEVDWNPFVSLRRGSNLNRADYIPNKVATHDKVVGYAVSPEHAMSWASQSCLSPDPWRSSGGRPGPWGRSRGHQRALFDCAHDSPRSQMVESFRRSFAWNRYQASSAVPRPQIGLTSAP